MPIQILSACKMFLDKRQAVCVLGVLNLLVFHADSRAATEGREHPWQLAANLGGLIPVGGTAYSSGNTRDNIGGVDVTIRPAYGWTFYNRLRISLGLPARYSYIPLHKGYQGRVITDENNFSVAGSISGEVIVSRMRLGLSCDIGYQAFRASAFRTWDSQFYLAPHLSAKVRLWRANGGHTLPFLVGSVAFPHGYDPQQRGGLQWHWGVVPSIGVEVLHSR